MRIIDADEAQKYADENMTEFSAGIVRFALSVAKTIEAEPVRHGRWCRGQCTACETINPAYKKDWNGDYIFKETPYCPNCGAKMDMEG